MNGYFSRLHRKRNEQGFILPLTLVLTFLFFGFLLHEIKMYETEKKFYHLREEMFTLDLLLQTAATDIEERLAEEIPADGGGTIRYINGTVRYTVIQPSWTLPENAIYMKLTAHTDSGGEHVSYVYYDIVKKRIFRWEEAV